MAVTMLSSEADVLTAQMFRDCLYRLVSVSDSAPKI